MEGWEDQIDVDDSDLHFVLRPHELLPSSSSSSSSTHCLHRCSQIPSSSQTLNPIPSIPPSQSQIPTHISDIIQNQQQEHHPKLSTSRPLISGPAAAIQLAMRRKSAAAASKRSPLEEQGNDVDLVDLCAREEDGDFNLSPWHYSLSFLRDCGGNTDSNLTCPISVINAQRCTTQRIPQVVGIVKSCTPNGLGDLFITLKDPTGTIGAAVHRKALSEGNICAEISVGCVLILKQVVALRPAYSCYLNITLKNVVKLIAKDCQPPQKQITSPFTFKYGAEWHGKQTQAELPAGEPSFNTRYIAKITDKENTTEKIADSRKPESLSGSIFAQTTVKPATRTCEPPRLISKASVAEWTEEQLEKLFSDYEDDIGLVRPVI